ncbi:MAG: hypothetical protein IKK24_03890 [Clostridia bacterium]|nr:hypothetical protein [Clostridia bacterium]
MQRKYIYRTCVFSLLGTLLFISKIIMELLPNIHIIALLITVYTVVYRKWALVPVYVFVMLSGIMYGFGTWWVPYLYIWLPIWGAVMLLPKNMPKKIAVPVYMVVGMLHGLLYGVMYAPFQAFAFGLDFEGTIAWIISGLPFDLLHGIGNLLSCTLVIPIAVPLKKVSERFL